MTAMLIAAAQNGLIQYATTNGGAPGLAVQQQVVDTFDPGTWNGNSRLLSIGAAWGGNSVVLLQNTASQPGNAPEFVDGEIRFSNDVAGNGNESHYSLEQVGGWSSIEVRLRLQGPNPDGLAMITTSKDGGTTIEHVSGLAPTHMGDQPGNRFLVQYGNLPSTPEESVLRYSFAGFFTFTTRGGASLTLAAIDPSSGQ